MTMEAALPFRSLRMQMPVMLVSTCHGATHWIVATFYLLLPAMSRELGLTYTETGLLVSSFWIGSIVANLPAGMAVDLTGRRLLIQLIALLLGAAALALIGVVTGFAALCLILATLGISNTIWHPAAITYLSILLPKHRGYSMAIHSLFANIGDAAAPVVAGWMLLMLSWQHTAELNALAGIVGAAVMVLALGWRDRDAGMKRRQPIRRYWAGMGMLLRSRAQWSFFLMAGFRTMTQGGLLAFLPLYLSHDLQMSSFAMGIAMMALQAGGMIATPAAGVLSDRIGRRPVVLAGMTSTTVIVVLLTFIRDPIIYVTCISLLGFFMYATRPVVQSWQVDRSPPELLASLTSAMFTVQAVLASLAPLIGGVLADRYGLISVFYFLAATVLISNLLCLMVPGTEHGD